MKTPSRPTHASGLLTAVLVIAVLALAPFVGGRDLLVQTVVLAVVALIAFETMILSRSFDSPVSVWPFVVFIGLVAASFIATVSLHAAIEKTLYFAACAAVAIAASSALRGDKRFTSATFALVGAGLVLGAMAVVEYHGSGNGWRVFGPFVSPGYFGGYLVMVIPVALAVFLSGRSIAVIAGGGLAWGFSLAALCLTGTRLALAFTAVSIVIFLALTLWRRILGKAQLIRLVIAVLVALVAAHFSLAPTESRVKGKAAAEQAHSLPFRIETWKGTANIIRAHPILGTGAGTFELVFPRYMVAGYTRAAHNSYLQLASEAGIPALLAAAAAFGTLFLAGYKNLKREDDGEGKLQLLLPNGASLMACSLAAALVGALARNAFDSDIYNPGIGFTFWILAGSLAARTPVNREVKSSTAVRAGFTILIGVMIVVWALLGMAKSTSETGVALLRSGDPMGGIDHFRSAVAIDPLCGEYRMYLGQSLVYTAGDDEAQRREGVASLEKAIRLEPTRARNMIALGRILKINGDDKGALNMFNKALDVDPYATPAMLAIAEILIQSEKTRPEAERMYERLIKQENGPIEKMRGVPEIVNPDYVWAHLYFGEKYISLKQYKEAAEQFSAVIERLELRKSFTVQRRAAEAAGMVDSAEESALDDILQRSKDALAEARSNLARTSDVR